MADYALRLREQLAYVNEHSFNNFRIRIGNTNQSRMNESRIKAIVDFIDIIMIYGGLNVPDLNVNDGSTEIFFLFCF